MSCKNEKKIYCMTCDKEVVAKLISGREAYPNQPRLYTRMFWQCPYCKCFVGTHKKSGIELGCIPTDEMKVMRKNIHNLLDPIWKGEYLDRQTLYKIMSNELGYEYHTAQIRTMEDAYKIEALARKLYNEIVLSDFKLK